MKYRVFASIIMTSKQLNKRRFLSVNLDEVDIESKDSSSVRVMQWNILADALSYSTPMTNFVKCSPDVLNWSNRGKRILNDIVLYAPDLICLEEVDHFYDYFLPHLKEKGYDGHFIPKPDSPCLRVPGHLHPDGCAMFVKKDRLEFDQVVEECLKGERDENTNQVAILASINDLSMNKTLIAGVCHLKAKKGNEKLRVFQAKDFLSKIKKIESYNLTTPIILCGDFNATPDEPVYEEIQKFELKSSYVSASHIEAPFTTWKFRPTGEVQHTIDYIWHSSNFVVKNYLEIPSPHVIGSCGLPSMDFPSDHLSLVFDYSFS